MVDQTQNWPGRVNWGSSVSETFEFRSEIVTSRSGKEQRRALRDRPRISWNFGSWSKEDSMERLLRTIRMRGGETFTVGHPTEIAATTAPANIGDTVVVVSEIFPWMVGGAVGVLQGEYNELVEIVNVLGNAITVANPLLNVWPAAVLRRGVSVRADQPLKVIARTNDLVSFETHMDVEPDGFYTNSVPPAGTPFNGREVFSVKPNWSSSTEFTFDSGREVVDFGAGRKSYSNPLSSRIEIHKSNFSGLTHLEVQKILGVFMRAKGQRGEFYKPTWMSDIRPALPFVIGENKLVADGAMLNLSLSADNIVKTICVQLSNGELLYRIITGTAVVSGRTELTLNTNWLYNVPLDQIMMVSYMPLTRFGSDSFNIEWLTSTVAEINMSFRELEHLAGI